MPLFLRVGGLLARLSNQNAGNDLRLQMRHLKKKKKKFLVVSVRQYPTLCQVRGTVVVVLHELM